MTTLTIKNIPEELYQKLKHQAAAHHRSLNSEIIVTLEQALHEFKPSTQMVLEEARKIREKTTKYRLTSKKLKDVKNRGRL